MNILLQLAAAPEKQLDIINKNSLSLIGSEEAPWTDSWTHSFRSFSSITHLLLFGLGGIRDSLSSKY